MLPKRQPRLRSSSKAFPSRSWLSAASSSRRALPKCCSLSGLQSFSSSWLRSTLQAIDVKKFVAAAMSAFPPGFRYLVVARFVLTTVGSALVIVLLALPPAGDYFD
jgi:hypothetical protein